MLTCDGVSRSADSKKMAARSNVCTGAGGGAGFGGAGAGPGVGPGFGGAGAGAHLSLRSMSRWSTRNCSTPSRISSTCRKRFSLTSCNSLIWTARSRCSSSARSSAASRWLTALRFADSTAPPRMSRNMLSRSRTNTFRSSLVILLVLRQLHEQLPLAGAVFRALAVQLGDEVRAHLLHGLRELLRLGRPGLVDVGKVFQEQPRQDE